MEGLLLEALVAERIADKARIAARRRAEVAGPRRPRRSRTLGIFAFWNAR